MKLNVPQSAKTHQGGVASVLSPEQELRRTVACALLWEDSFYESGVSLVDRIKSLVPACRPDFVAACAFEARTKWKLRHMPLLLARELARATPSHRHVVGKLLPDIIQRADELAEFLAIYWKDGKQPISKQVKKGLAKAFPNFNEYALAKYNKDGAIKLRDVLFMCHAKPKDAEQERVFKALIDGKLETPDTWEVALSGGADKKETFTRLMAENKLGALAFLRNLRNMHQAGIDKDIVKAYASTLNVERVLPFRFLSAARAVPQWEDMLEPLMLKACVGREQLKGRTKILVDVSGSMNAPISSKSDLLRLDAAYGVAVLLREICEDVDVYTFSQHTKLVPPRHGFALRDAMHTSQEHGSTYLKAAIQHLNDGPGYDRLIVITDEQSSDGSTAHKGKHGYIINVAAYKNGVGYGQYTHISGWSEGVIDYITESERSINNA